MKRALKLLAALLLIAYPAAVYFGLLHFGLAPLAWMLVAAGLLRLALGYRDRSLWPVALVAIAVGAGSALLRSVELLRYYPALINLVCLMAFGWSLWHPPTIVERIARLQDPALSAAGVAWTRAVTRVWCAFFIVNGTLAVLTARFASLQTWTLYNGLVAYVMMGLLFGGEWLLRRRRLLRAA
jgi:uncharacterized membrane protein